jgi:hypothetical protein
VRSSRGVLFLSLLGAPACSDDAGNDGDGGDGGGDGHIRASLQVEGGETYEIDVGATSSMQETLWGCEGRDADGWGVVLTWDQTVVTEPGEFEVNLTSGTTLWLSRPDPNDPGLTVGTADGTIAFTTVDYEAGLVEGEFEGLYERDDPDDTISVTIAGGEFSCEF